MLLTSCTGETYQNAIPRGCTALMSADLSATENLNETEGGNLLKSVFALEDLSQSGIDLSCKLYLFESADGYFGMVAAIDKEKVLRQWMTDLEEKGTVSPLPDRKGKHFCVVSDAWLMAYDADKMLVMGPVVPTAQGELSLQMARYMEQDERQGMNGTALMTRLGELTSPLALVAQTAALPESLAAIFAIGAPKDADASQIVVAAEMEVAEGTLVVKGETFSFNKSIDAQLKKAQQSFRPMKGVFASRIPQASLAWMANVEGGTFYEMLQQDKALKGLLTGANISFDFNKVVGDINGDMVVVVDSAAAAKPRITMLAQRADGTEYFASTDASLKAATAFDSAASPLSASQQSLLQTSRCSMVVQLSQMGNGKVADVVKTVLRPLFGDIDTIVYIMK